MDLRVREADQDLERKYGLQNERLTDCKWKDRGDRKTDRCRRDSRKRMQTATEVAGDDVSQDNESQTQWRRIERGKK